MTRSKQVQRVVVRHRNGGRCEQTEDSMVVEEPLEIRLGDDPLAVLMRTPGDDISLAVGFLFSEGILSHPDQVLSAAHCTDPDGESAGNVVRVLADSANPEAAEKARRQVYASSSCGLCGKTTLDSVRLLCRPIQPPRPLSASTLLTLPERLRAEQQVFHDTGGLHAAGLFSLDGTLLMVREDIGRHNACDKILGAMVLREQWPLEGHMMMLSGRASFEMVQKAAMAGIQAVLAVSAPSSLAVDLARELGITLVGFLRGDSLNVYSGEVVA